MMKNKAVVVKGAPAPSGPYSMALDTGGLVFVAGQIPMDPVTGQLVTGNIAAQTERVILNIKSVLEAANLGLSDVVKTTVFMRDLSQFQAMNEAYSKFFHEPYPARSTIEVSRLPREAVIEIEAIAVRQQ